MAASPTTAVAAAEPHMSARRLIAFFALVFGMFMAILDIQIVSASLSEIQAGLSAPPDEISWVQTSYLVAEIVMIPLSGYLARAMSTRILFTISAAGFTVASLLCATATSLNEMILFRALQGFIGGGMIPTAFAAAYTIFPKNNQAGVMALVGLTVTLAPTIGPTVGGYLTELFSWHWLFLVNVPAGILAATLAWTLVDFDEPDWHLLRRLDVLGLAAMAIFLGTLEYVLEEGPRDAWFESSTLVALSLVSIVAAVIFFYRALSVEEPIVDLGAYVNRNFAVGSLLTFVLGIGLYGLTFLYPLFLARVRDYNALQIGETVFVTGTAMFFAAPIIGRLARKIDPRIVILAGFVGFTVSTVDLLPITADWGFWQLFWPQVLRGFSLMACMVPINILALGTLPPHKLKNASGLFNLMRNLGGAFGLAGISTVLDDRWDLHMERLRESVTWGRWAVADRLDALAAHFGSLVGAIQDDQALKQVALIVRHQALVMAFSDVFLVLAVLFGSGIPLIILVQRPKGGAAAAAASEAH